jgi:hypothetical protein
MLCFLLKRPSSRNQAGNVSLEKTTIEAEANTEAAGYVDTWNKNKKLLYCPVGAASVLWDCGDESGYRLTPVRWSQGAYSPARTGISCHISKCRSVAGKNEKREVFALQ